MNGIRLAVIAAAAFVFLPADSAEVMAQNRGQAYADAYGGGQMGPGMKSKKTASPPRGQQQDQPMSGPPGGIPTSRGGARSNSRASSSGSRRGSSRSSRSSRGGNAIETNPLFQLLDSNGDGELSLEEIDAASRLLYNLDVNEDDRITADEVEDMADGGSNNRSNSRDDFAQQEDSRSSRSSSRSSRGSSSRGSSRGAPGGGGGGVRGGARGGGPSGLTGGNKKHEYVPNSKAMGMMGGSRGAPGGGTGNAAAAADDDFAGNDENNDGVLKRSEMPRSLRSKFTKMDTNKDGEIDEDEFYDFIDNQ